MGRMILNVFIIIILLTYPRLSNGDKCEPCRCRRSLIDCSWGKLHSIPILAENITKQKTYLILRDNNITIINTTILHMFKHLKRLRLTHNNIIKLDVGTFIQLPKLEELYLSDNKISKLDGHVFKGLGNLKKLEINGNNIEKLDKNAFNGLESLTTLSLRHNHIKQIHQGTLELPKLQKLYLSMNMISKLGRYVFKGLGKLKTLRLGGNNITELDNSSFTNLTNLRGLYLHGNKISRIDRHAFKGLLNLTTLWLDSNEVKKSDKHVFKGLRNLKSLQLESNNIEQIHQGTFELPKLVRLKLTKNMIEKLDPYAFKGLGKLTSLWLSSNNITKLDNDLFTELPNLLLLRLNENKISEIDRHAFKGLVNLNMLWLNGNKVKKLDKHVFGGLGNLKKLWLNGNRLREIPNALWMSKLHRVKVYIQDNPFLCTCKVSNNMEQLRHLTDALYSNYKCNNATTVICEESRNYAFGMQVSLGGVFESLGSNDINNINDGNLSTFYAFAVNVSNVGNTGWIEIDLPGKMIAVKTVVIYGDRSIADAMVFVGNASCGSCSPARFSNLNVNTNCHTFRSHCNVTCNYTACGSRVKIEFRTLWSRPCNKTVKLIREVVIYRDIWKQWENWSPCTKTCGIGIKSRLRSRTKCHRLEARDRELSQTVKDICDVKSCPKHIWFEVIGGLTAFFVLLLVAIVVGYRRYMARRAPGLSPNNPLPVNVKEMGQRNIGLTCEGVTEMVESAGTSKEDKDATEEVTSI